MSRASADRPTVRVEREGAPVGARKVAYVMSRFPKITETFVLYEMKALEDRDVHVEVFPLLREPDGPRHPEALAFEARAHFVSFASRALLAANLRRFVRGPAAYLGTWWEALRGTFGSANFFLGALAYFPKCVAFAERIEALGVDHVHAHFASHPALAALILHRLTGVPYSFTAHGSDLHVERRMLDEKVRHASFVVAVSEYNRALILDECDGAHAEKVVVIHCGVDRATFGSGGRRRRVSDPSTDGRDRGDGAPSLNVVCVASLEEVKGHRFLIEACRLLTARGVDVRCELAGGGSLRSDVERRIHEAGLDDRVRVHGPAERAEVCRLLDEADVAVLCSQPTRSGRREGIPVALMEAMMSGLPVVASGVSGVPELVDDGRTGFLVPPGDPWLLAARLETLARSPTLRGAMGRAGREKVSREFDLSEGARRLAAEIDRHAASSRCRDT